MNKIEAKNLIKSVLESEFSTENLKNLVINIFKRNYEISTFGEGRKGAYIPDQFKNSISSYNRILKYSDSDDNEIDVLYVKVKNSKILTSARTTQRNFIANYLKNKDRSSALVAFYCDEYQDWRLSFIKLDFKTNEEKFKDEIFFSSAKRLSYLVGKSEKSHTAQNQIIKLILNDNRISQEDLENSFSVEVVTSDFFNQYLQLFNRMVENLNELLTIDCKIRKDFEYHSITPENFVKKLLGQIVFLYFLQKKGLLGVDEDKSWGSGDIHYLRTLFNESIKGKKNFFNDVLEHLFYDALNNSKRDLTKAYIFPHLKDYKKKIPFLNGGLFEPIKDYQWQSTDIVFNNDLFSNKITNKDGDVGDGILDIFDRYNFTVKEDEPLEKEVAIDPEMLGKVFENLLESKERKSKGAFYTPREIVHYMCKESILHYLDNYFQNVVKNVSVPNIDNLRKFVEIDRLERIEEYNKDQQDTINKQFLKIKQYSKEFDKALESIKICDPAIGSGAFPVAILNEIVRIRENLRAITDNLPKINKYKLKLNTIQNSIYGVDIDESAVDIAKLRLWLSLVVDEEDNSSISPLPNLDYKIVCGNSLIGLPNDYTPSKMKEIEDLKLKYFNESDKLKKEDFRKQINAKLEPTFKNSEKIFGYKIDFDFKMNFSEVFSGNDGFDVVIGNPPYVQLKWLKQDYSKCNYSTFSKSTDIYCLFFEKANSILSLNSTGAFITSNKWLKTEYGSLAKDYFLRKTSNIRIMDFGGYQVFDNATVDTNIILWKNNSIGTNKISYKDCENISLLYSNDTYKSCKVTKDDKWALKSNFNLSIKEKLETKFKRIESFNVEFNYGILTGANKTFILDENKRQELLNNCKNASKYIVPILRGKDLEKYYYKFNNYYLLNIHNGNAKKKIKPVVLDLKNDICLIEYFNKFGDEFRNRGEMGHNWYNLRSCNYIDLYQKPKILYADIVQDFGKFYLDINGYFTNDTAFMIFSDDIKLLKYLTGVLNSKISNYLYKHFYCGGTLGKNGMRFKKEFLQKLPVPNQNQIIINIVDEILKLKKENKETTELENKIDLMLYKLYDLTYEEVKIVEPEFSLSQAEYDKFKIEE